MKLSAGEDECRAMNAPPRLRRMADLETRIEAATIEELEAVLAIDEDFLHSLGNASDKSDRSSLGKLRCCQSDAARVLTLIRDRLRVPEAAQAQEGTP